MLKGLFVKVAKMFGMEVVEKAPVAHVTKRHEDKIKEADTYANTDLNSEKERKVLKNAVEDIQSEILRYGYKEIPAILADYETGCIAHFVMMQEIQLGSYNKETDTLESLTREQLINRALDNNKLQFRQRMFEQGKVKNASQSQLDKITELATKYHEAVDMSKIKNSFDASDMIEFLMKKNNVQPTKPSGLATANQIKAVQNICRKLNLEVAADMIDSFESASDTIAELSKQVPASEPKPASEKQVEYACRLWKMLGHRATAQKKAKFAEMNAVELSKVIDEMNKKYYTENPEANLPSSGQLDYIRQLCELTLTPIPAEMPATKAEASKSIENLNKKYLYVLTRVSSPSLTKEEIKKMPIATVKEMIFNIKTERKTNNYTDNSNGTGGYETGSDRVITF